MLCVFRIHTIPSVPIVDCYQKIRQQVKVYLQMAGVSGKNELNEVGLQVCSPASIFPIVASYQYVCLCMHTRMHVHFIFLSLNGVEDFSSNSHVCAHKSFKLKAIADVHVNLYVCAHESLE
jgi:hypothetical protein